MSNYESLFRHTADAMCEICVDGSVQRVNAQCAALLGEATPDTGSNLATLFDEAGRAELAHLLDQLQSGSNAGGMAGQLTATQAWTNWQLTKLTNEKVVAIVRDASDLQPTGQDRADAPAADQLSKIAGGIAHDFNNLLMAIAAPAEMALFKAGTESTLAEDLQLIVDAGARGAALTQKLLTFSRRNHGKASEVQLPKLIDGIQTALKQSLGNDITLDIKIGTKTAQVHANERQIEQILLNLTANAADAIQGKGHVQIETETIEVTSGHAGLRGASAGHYIALSVTDDGGGIDPEDLPRIFDPLFTTKKGGACNGLGLATCHDIAEHFGGAIRARSSLGEGTTITVLLPRYVDGDADLSATKSRAATDADGAAWHRRGIKITPAGSQSRGGGTGQRQP
jgi:two-component system, cell cycle sensor histidine kinase and response regulator CckA